MENTEGHKRWNKTDSTEHVLTPQAKGSPRLSLWSSVPKAADGCGVPTIGEGSGAWKSSSQHSHIPPVLPTWGLRRVKINPLPLCVWVCEPSNTVSLDCFPATGKLYFFLWQREINGTYQTERIRSNQYTPVQLNAIKCHMFLSMVFYTSLQMH